MQFDDMATMEKMFAGMMGGGGGGHKKGGSRRKKGGNGPSMSQMNKMYEKMMMEAFKDMGLD
jgi:hypothetical protein